VDLELLVIVGSAVGAYFTLSSTTKFLCLLFYIHI